MKEINVNSMEYRKLSKEDKLKVVKAKIKKILESKDTKVTQEYYKGKKVNVPKEKIGIFKDLCEREKSLEKYVTLEEVTEVEKTKYTYATEDENPYETGYSQFVVNSKSETKINTNDVNEDNSNVINNNGKKTIYSRVEKNNDIEENNECQELMVLNDTKSNNKKKMGFGKKLLGAFLGLSLVKKAKGIWHKAKEKVTKNSKPENLRDKSRKNRLKVKICAFALAATALVCSFLPKGNNNSKKNSKKNSNNVSKPTSSVTDIANNEVKNNDIIIEETTEKTEEIVEKVEEPVIEDENYILGDTINIEDNAYIYTNSYDATDKTNYYTPYYNGTYDREIVGVTYELDGNLYTIYKYDVNASDKINELISKGAKQTAVLVVRSDLSYTNDYEGYYNVDTIKKVKTK